MRRMRKCAPLDKAGEHRIDIGTDHVQGIEGLARRTAADKPATGLGPERDFPELSPHRIVRQSKKDLAEVESCNQ